MYDLDDIVPPAELSAIPVITGEDGKGASLPWSRSEWVNRHFGNLMKTPSKANKEKL